MPLTTLLTMEPLQIQQQKWLTLYVCEGLAQIQADNVSVMVQAAEKTRLKASQAIAF